MIVSGGLIIGGIIAAIMMIAVVAGTTAYVTSGNNNSNNNSNGNSNADLNAVSAANKKAAADAALEVARLKQEAADRIAELEKIQKEAEQKALDAQLIADLSRDLRTNLSAVNALLTESKDILANCKSKMSSASAEASGRSSTDLDTLMRTMNTFTSRIEGHIASIEQIAADINTSLNNVTVNTVVTTSRVDSATNKRDLIEVAKSSFDAAHTTFTDTLVSMASAEDRQKIVNNALKNDLALLKTTVDAKVSTATSIVGLMAPLLQHVDTSVKSAATQGSNAAKSAIVNAGEFDTQRQSLLSKLTNDMYNTSLHQSIKASVDNLASVVVDTTAIAVTHKNNAQQAEHDYEIGIIAGIAQRLQAALNAAQLEQAANVIHLQNINSAAVLIRQYGAVAQSNEMTNLLSFIDGAVVRSSELSAEVNTLISVNMTNAISSDDADAAEAHLSTIMGKSDMIETYANDAANNAIRAEQLHTEFLEQSQFGFDLDTNVTFALASDGGLSIKADGGQSDGNPHVLHDDCEGRGSCQYNVIKSQFGDQYFIQAGSDPSLFMMLDEASAGERLELDNSCDLGVDNALCQWTITDDGGKYEIASVADSKLVIGAEGGQDKGDRIRVDECSGNDDCRWDISSA